MFIKVVDNYNGATIEEGEIQLDTFIDANTQEGTFAQNLVLSKKGVATLLVTWTKLQFLENLEEECFV